MVVGCGVPLEDLHTVVQTVVLPGYQALVLQGVRQEGGSQDTGGVLDGAVLDALEAVFALEDGILPVADGRELHVLVGPALALRLGHGGPLAVPFCFGHGGRVQLEEGIYPGPQDAVSLGLEGIYHYLVGIAVFGGHIPFIQEGIGVPEAVRHLHGIPGQDAGEGILHVSEKVEILFFRESVFLVAERGVRKGRKHTVLHGENRIRTVHREGSVQARSPGDFHPHRLGGDESRDGHRP